MGDRYQAETLRVLFVTSTAKRRKNILKKLQALEENQHFAVAHRELVTTENALTSPIWYQSGVLQPVALFGKRSIVSVAQKGETQVPTERIIAVFQDWWQAYEFPSVSVEYGEQKTAAIQDQMITPTYLALGKWSSEQWLAMHYQFVTAKQIHIVATHLLSSEETHHLRTKLYM